jgi:hypothetical protein
MGAPGQHRQSLTTASILGSFRVSSLRLLADALAVDFPL